MIYVDIVYQSNLTGKWMTEEKEFNNRGEALRYMYAMRGKGFIIDGWRCDDALDNEWLTHRFKL